MKQPQVSGSKSNIKMKTVLSCDEMNPIPSICRRESKAHLLMTHESLNKEVNKEVNKEPEHAEKYKDIHTTFTETTCSTDNESSIVEAALKTHEVSDELREIYRMDRQYKRLLYKTTVHQPIEDDVHSQLAEIIIDPKKKRKRRKRSSSMQSQLSAYNELVQSKIRKLNAYNESDLDYDPLIEELKDNHVDTSTDISDDERSSVYQPEPIVNNIHHFYRTTKRIYSLSNYIKYRSKKDGV